MRKILMILACAMIAVAASAQKYTQPKLENGNAAMPLNNQVQTMIKEKVDAKALGLIGKPYMVKLIFKVNAEAKVENLTFDDSIFEGNASIDKEVVAKLQEAIKEIMAESKWIAGTKDDKSCSFDIQARVIIPGGR